MSVYGYVEDLLHIEENILIRFQDGNSFICDSSKLVAFIPKILSDSLVITSIIMLDHDDLILEVF